MPEIPIYFVDAFASGPFRGNPAAVCILPPDHKCTDDWMQQVASEINLSETAFVIPETGSLRWFTPKAEVDLCGHATLAATFAFSVHGVAEIGTCVEFHTRSGKLIADLMEDGQVQIDLPATPPTPVEVDEGCRSLFPGAVAFLQSKFDLLVEMGSEAEVVQMDPDFRRLKQLDYRGIMVTAMSDQPGIDFVSRFFAPAHGIDEDPVTGSAHCCLTPFWGARLQKHNMKAVQMSERRGDFDITWAGDRVKLRGKAVLTIKGSLVANADS